MDEEKPEDKALEEQCQRLLQSVVGGVRTSNRLPGSGTDYDFYSSFPEFVQIMRNGGKEILRMMVQIMTHQNARKNLTALVNVDDIFDNLIDSNDLIMERVGSLIDEASGVKKHAEIVSPVTEKPSGSKVSTNISSWNKHTLQSPQKSGTSRKPFSMKHIPKPQLNFKDKVDNSHRPFVHKIRRKPNATRPLPDALLALPVDISEVDETALSDPFLFEHPYQEEIENFTPPAHQLKREEPAPVIPLDTSPLLFVATKDDLSTMMDDLRSSDCFAVDLEHHSYRSYQGFTCLMQISTRQCDYIVDTIELRSELKRLNKVFTNPSKLKIFHGADMDIIWLQRDLGIYVVNMFDTGQAARVLEMARFSLAHLLKHYCQVATDKRYQVADWRMRPIPSEMLEYARNDTHYLLHIYEQMRNELIDRSKASDDLLQVVYSRSNAVCLKQSAKPQATEEHCYDIYQRSKRLFNGRQLGCFKALYEWRDRIARKEDESTGYVLPNHMMLQVAEIMPKEMQGVLACCNPIPNLVRLHVHTIHQIINEARQLPLQTTQKKQVQPMSLPPVFDSENLLNNPHDLSHQNPEEGDEPVLRTTATALNPTLMKQKPEVDLARPKSGSKSSTAQKIKASFQSPFYMYLPKSESDAAAKERNPFQETWKLRKVVPPPKPVTLPPQLLPPPTDAADKDQTEDRNVIPLSQLLSKKKKKRKSEGMDFEAIHRYEEGQEQALGEDGDMAPIVTQKHSSHEQEDFEPFDYSQADLTQFQEDRTKKRKSDQSEPRAKRRTNHPNIRPVMANKSSTFSVLSSSKLNKYR